MESFGGFTITFAGRKETAEEVFGAENLTPAEMTARLWVFIRANGLSAKSSA